jgi:hypothetical protein
MQELGRPARAFAASLMAVALTGIAPAGSWLAQRLVATNRSGTQPPDPDHLTKPFYGVTILSACDAWAVCNFRDSTTIDRLAIHCC